MILFFPVMKRFIREGWVLSLFSLIFFTAPSVSPAADISVQGLNDKQVYSNSVTFTVNSEEGYDYIAELNGVSVEIDVPIEVREPDYYELYVQRRKISTSAEESRLIQFIVRASERGNTEWGLPPWTPYPLIDSAEAEFTGARLTIVTPAQYPVGLEIPVIARIEDESGKRLGVNGKITAAGFEEHPLKLFRGVGSMFLPAATESGVISYPAQIQSLQISKQIIIEPATNWQIVSDDISASTDWGENARIHITGIAGNLLTIASDTTLNIGAGSVIIIDPDITIDVLGRIVVNGTKERPAVFTAPNRSAPWGGFLFETSSSEGSFTGAILTASGADASWFDHNPGHGSSHRKEQCLFYLSNGAHVTLTDCYLIENHGQAGHGENGYLTMTGSLVQKCITTGQYNGGEINFTNCALIEFPSAKDTFADADNDAIYLTRGIHALTNCLIGWLLDDGIDAGDNTSGDVSVTGCWFESCYHEAMAWSGNQKLAHVRDTVTLNCGQGIECGYDSPDVNAVHYLSTANLVGARFGDNYDWTYNGFLTVSDSLLLFNKRDVWGRAWDDWTVHLSQMDIQDNYLTMPNDNYPNNMIWDPMSDPNQLAFLMPFLPAPADTVGIGIATLEDSYDLAKLTGEPPSDGLLEAPIGRIPVRLSTFTTNQVSVDYAVYTDDVLYDNGTLQFVPGETLGYIQFNLPPLEDLLELRVELSNPIYAELTGYRRITYLAPNEIVTTLIRRGDSWRYFKGTAEPPTDWSQPDFDDQSWLTGPTGIGYEAGSGYEACIATELSDMRNNYLSVYARREFLIEDLSQLTGLTLTMEYDDGYIAYLNGVPVASRYAPDPPAYDQPATTDNHEACCGNSCTFEQVDLSDDLYLLTPGPNVLAVQVHNTNLSSSDFIFVPELFAGFSRLP
jgi:hypothetical protein